MIIMPIFARYFGSQTLVRMTDASRNACDDVDIEYIYEAFKVRFLSELADKDYELKPKSGINEEQVEKMLHEFFDFDMDSPARQAFHEGLSKRGLKIVKAWPDGSTGPRG